ncbi:FAD/NAD(P)-binding domain-containing protein [Hypoxylon fragiforme]|uniref:FAD/NAD(P)-binding domain-containing protein n=1 Tax=Hypoxylon fragiforme TaxID=63214 RepID=UPI0020C6E291|nr:FAD/NAD(P)-binding domain-containing protein [Hypoxylon fragiforme]KAI2608663.1 FAD/NAD(P)-binding domain-containing protein [Hypoxylon fragiforme]
MGSYLPSSPAAPRPFSVQRVAVIGAGPSGLASAKYLLAQKAGPAAAAAFARVDVFEQQAKVGGVWNYSPTPRPVEELPVPQTDAHPKRPDPPIWGDKGGDGNGGEGKKPLFPSPMYEDLHTNIPHTLMRYSDLPFKEGCEIFPTRGDVQEYLEQYAADVRHVIRFSTQVTGVALRPGTSFATAAGDGDKEQDQWDVRTTDLLTDKETTETYDAVVVASGHYSTPYIPDSIGNIDAFHAAHPGLISHSKLYRNPELYRGKKVVVVGTGASGLDIASQIQAVCKPPLLVSAQTEVPPETLAHIGNVKQVGQIKRFLVEERGAEFLPLSDSGPEEGGAGIETDIDAVLFCTGYLFTFPFLNTLQKTPLVTDGRQVYGVAKHLLHVAHPTLAFPGLPIKVIPFPLAEAQAAVLARLWSNQLPLPMKEVLEEWERLDGEGTAPGKFHVFPKGGDGRYINELHDWVTRYGVDGGKEPPHWDEEMLWQRGIYAEAKMQFEKMGKKAKTLEELGFRYEPEKVVVPEDVAEGNEKMDVAG